LKRSQVAALWSLSCLSCVAVGCSHVPAIAWQPTSTDVPGSQVTVTAETAEDQGEVEPLATRVGEALPLIQRWGGLRVPTQIVILPDHGELERRIHLSGYAWLRAWARYDVVYVQSPRTWHFLVRPSERELRELLTHELTHCAMYQAISDAGDWDRVFLPLWFREGMASWTAGETDKRYPASDLHRFVGEHPDLDPLRQAERMVQDDSRLVYSAAHWAFDVLAARGTDRVTRLLAGMRSGRSFEQAFETAYGETEGAFEDEVLSAWRSRPTGPKTTDVASSPDLRL
jgi:hypothetical protein